MVSVYPTNRTFELWIDKSIRKKHLEKSEWHEVKIRLQKVVDPIVNVFRQTEAQKKQTETEKTNLPFVLDIVVNVQNQGPRDYCTY